MWKFIEFLRDEQALVDVRLEHYVHGDQPKKPKAAYMRHNRRILNFVNDYNVRPPTDYLRGLPHNLEF